MQRKGIGNFFNQQQEGMLEDLHKVEIFKMKNTERFFNLSMSLYNFVLIFANIIAITHFKIDSSRINENGYLHTYIFWGIDVVNKRYDNYDIRFLKVFLFYVFIISQFLILGSFVYFSISGLLKLFRGVSNYKFCISRIIVFNSIFALMLTYFSSKSTVVIKILGLGGSQIFCLLKTLPNFL